MRNFLQFIIPFLVLSVIGLFLLIGGQPENDDKKLHIKCDGLTKSFEVFSGSKIDFMENNQNCNLNIEVANVDRNYIKLNTPYLWRLDYYGEIDTNGPRNVNIVETGEELILYSYDQKTKFIFSFK